MLSVQFITENPDIVRKNLTNRSGDPKVVDTVISLNQERKKFLLQVEQLKAERNRSGEEIAKLKKTGQSTDEIMGRMKENADKSKSIEENLSRIEGELNGILMMIPNMCHASVPIGKDANDNPEVRNWGTIPNFNFKPKDHVDLGEGLKILDFDRGAKLAGARFCVSYGAAAKLERALISYMLDVHTMRHGYREVLPPFMVNRASMTATGQLPKSEQDMFRVDTFDYFLIPTAEVPVTNLHRDEMLTEDQLPLFYCSYTPCFRAEAGSYGIDTRGLIRQHQFNKVELVKFVTPEKSYEEHEKLVKDAEAILQGLELSYRVVSLCTGDISFGAAKCYDLEVWLPSQQKHREISSCSNFEDFQARRGNIRFRRGAGKPEFVHTLNGSGLAVGRTLLAILENYQLEDGSVRIPAALKGYMGCDLITESGVR